MDAKHIDYDGTLKNDLSDSERRLLELNNGAEPKNESEIEMVKEIEEA